MSKLLAALLLLLFSTSSFAAQRIVVLAPAAADIVVAAVGRPELVKGAWIKPGAVVVDVGATMSHAVIVSRELGIPCAVSVRDATRRIPDGALIEVDGGSVHYGGRDITSLRPYSSDFETLTIVASKERKRKTGKQIPLFWKLPRFSSVANIQRTMKTRRRGDAEVLSFLYKERL